MIRQFWKADVQKITQYKDVLSGGGFYQDLVRSLNPDVVDIPLANLEFSLKAGSIAVHEGAIEKAAISERLEAATMEQPETYQGYDIHWGDTYDGFTAIGVTDGRLIRSRTDVSLERPEHTGVEDVVDTINGEAPSLESSTDAFGTVEQHTAGGFVTLYWILPEVSRLEDTTGGIRLSVTKSAAIQQKGAMVFPDSEEPFSKESAREFLGVLMNFEDPEIEFLGNVMVFEETVPVSAFE